MSVQTKEVGRTHVYITAYCTASETSSVESATIKNML